MIYRTEDMCFVQSVRHYNLILYVTKYVELSNQMLPLWLQSDVRSYWALRRADW